MAPSATCTSLQFGCASWQLSGAERLPNQSAAVPSRAKLVLQPARRFLNPPCMQPSTNLSPTIVDRERWSLSMPLCLSSHCRSLETFMLGLPPALARLEPHLPPAPAGHGGAQRQRPPAPLGGGGQLLLNRHGAAPAAEARMGVLLLQTTYVHATVLGRKLRVSSFCRFHSCFHSDSPPSGGSDTVTAIRQLRILLTVVQQAKRLLCAAPSQQCISNRMLRRRICWRPASASQPGQAPPRQISAAAVTTAARQQPTAASVTAWRAAPGRCSWRPRRSCFRLPLTWWRASTCCWQWSTALRCTPQRRRSGCPRAALSGAQRL